MHTIPDLLPYVGIGCILLISYLVFAYYVTRQADFYTVRRWKAAIWTTSLIFIFILFVLSIIIFGTVVINATLLTDPNISLGKKILEIFQLLNFVGSTLLVLFPCLVPFLFMGTFGFYFRMKQFLNSDDYLDKIWKDPNQGNKSPIQWL